MTAPDLDADHVGEGGRPAHHRSDAGRGAPLSIESAASVRDAAKAVLLHGARYLPIVENGTLVGVCCISQDGTDCAAWPLRC
jgi:CBS domain-containing protein